MIQEPFKITKIENGYLLTWWAGTNPANESYDDTKYFETFLKLWEYLGKVIDEKGIDDTYGLIVETNNR